MTLLLATLLALTLSSTCCRPSFLHLLPFFHSLTHSQPHSHCAPSPSGNGFSKERYAKLGLARPSPPKEWLAKKAEEERNASQLPAITAGTSYGLEGLRLLEGMDTPHAAGAITNPSAYRDPTRKSAGPQAAEEKSSAASGLLKSFGASSSFGNPTRKFAP